MKFLTIVTASLTILTACTTSQQPMTNVNENNSTTMDTSSKTIQATIQTSEGDIVVELFANKSPETVDNFVNLAKSGFYNGTRFHRVIKDFMIQGGDPLSKDVANKAVWGTGGPGYRFADEINSEKLVRGSLAMANAGPDTNGSQFFIVTAEATPWLDGKHTNFGRVTEGMDVIDVIENTKTAERDIPVTDIIISNIIIDQ